MYDVFDKVSEVPGNRELLLLRHNFLFFSSERWEESEQEGSLDFCATVFLIQMIQDG